MLKINASVNADYKLCDYLDTLREISFDSCSSHYLVNDKRLAVDFDLLTCDYFHNIDTPRSNDALLVAGSTIYVIEFKNQTKQNLNKFKLYEKNYATIITLVGYGLETLANIRNNYVYILVYNEKKPNSKGIIRNRTAGQAGTTIIPCKLQTFKGKYFKEVMCFSDPSEFEAFLENH